MSNKEPVIGSAAYYGDSLVASSDRARARGRVVLGVLLVLAVSAFVVGMFIVPDMMYNSQRAFNEWYAAKLAQPDTFKVRYGDFVIAADDEASTKPQQFDEFYGYRVARSDCSYIYLDENFVVVRGAGAGSLGYGPPTTVENVAGEPYVPSPFDRFHCDGRGPGDF
jgi:hypothetical protein